MTIRAILALALISLLTVAGGFAGAEPLDALSAVTVQASDIIGLVGHSEKNLASYAFRAGGFALIPWQRDAVNVEGKVELDQGRVTPTIAPHDELSWMASDLGERAPPAMVEAWRNKNALFEVEVGTLSGKSLWIYLRETAQPLLSPVDYVTYDSAGDAVTTPVYSLGFRDAVTARHFTWRQPDGTEGPNLMSRISVCFRARVLGIFPMKVSEDDFSNTIIGVKDGPVRVIKRVSSVAHLPFGFKGHPQILDYYFYRNAYRSEVHFTIPRQGKILLANARFTMALGMAPQQQPVTLDLPEGRRFIVEPRMPDETAVLQHTPPPSWIQFTGEAMPVGFVTYVRFPERERRVFEPQDLIYTKGTLQCDIRQRLERGEHSFSLNVFAVQPPQPVEKTIAAIERLWSDPLRLKTSVSYGAMTVPTLGTK